MSTKKRLRIVPSLVGGTPVLACTRFNNNTWQEYQQWMTTHQESYEQTYHRPLKCIYGCPREISHKKIPPEAQVLVIEMNNDENRMMGIGQIENKTASEVYRSPSRVVAFANAHSTPHSGTASNLAHNSEEHTAVGGRTPLRTPPFNQSNEVPVAGGRNPLTAVGGRNPLRTPLRNPPPFRKIFSDRNYTRYLYIGNSHYATREELERNYTPDAQYINKQLANILPQTPHPIESLERFLFKGAGHMKRGSGITRCSVAASLHAAKPHSATTQHRASPLKTKEQLPRQRGQPRREQPPQQREPEQPPQQREPEQEQPPRPQQQEQEQPPLQQ
jgi:hypothetical protein